MEWLNKFFYNSGRRDNTILQTSYDNKWIKAEIEGDFTCPDCKEIMMLVSQETWGYAFCPKCKQYWKSIS